MRKDQLAKTISVGVLVAALMFATVPAAAQDAPPPACPRRQTCYRSSKRYDASPRACEVSASPGLPFR